MNLSAYLGQRDPEIATRWGARLRARYDNVPLATLATYLKEQSPIFQHTYSNYVSMQLHQYCAPSHRELVWRMVQVDMAYHDVIAWLVQSQTHPQTVFYPHVNKFFETVSCIAYAIAEVQELLYALKFHVVVQHMRPTGLARFAAPYGRSGRNRFRISPSYVRTTLLRMSFDHAACTRIMRHEATQHQLSLFHESPGDTDMFSCRQRAYWRDLRYVYWFVYQYIVLQGMESDMKMFLPPKASLSSMHSLRAIVQAYLNNHDDDFKRLYNERNSERYVTLFFFPFLNRFVKNVKDMSAALKTAETNLFTQFFQTICVLGNSKNISAYYGTGPRTRTWWKYVDQKIANNTASEDEKVRKSNVQQAYIDGRYDLLVVYDPERSPHSDPYELPAAKARNWLTPPEQEHPHQPALADAHLDRVAQILAQVRVQRQRTTIAPDVPFCDGVRDLLDRDQHRFYWQPLAYQTPMQRSLTNAKYPSLHPPALVAADVVPTSAPAPVSSPLPTTTTTVTTTHAHASSVLERVRAQSRRVRTDAHEARVHRHDHDKATAARVHALVKQKHASVMGRHGAGGGLTIHAETAPAAVASTDADVDDVISVHTP